MIVLQEDCSTTTDSGSICDVDIVKINVVTGEHNSSTVTTSGIGIPVACIPTGILDSAVFAFVQVSTMSISILDNDVSELTIVTVVVDCTSGTGRFCVSEVTVNYLTVVSTSQPVKTSTVST